MLEMRFHHNTEFQFEKCHFLFAFLCHVIKRIWPTLSYNTCIKVYGTCYRNCYKACSIKLSCFQFITVYNLWQLASYPTYMYIAGMQVWPKGECACVEIHWRKLLWQTHYVIWCVAGIWRRIVAHWHTLVCIW